MNLSEKRLFLFDIDGTLALGDKLFEGTRELLEYIDRIGGSSFFITNNSTKGGADYVKRFRKSFGLETTPEQFVTSGFMMKKFLLETYKDKRIYVQGTKSYLSELSSEGLLVTDEILPKPDCVVVAYDSEITYEKVSKTCLLLQQYSLPFYATNPDLRCPVDGGFIPDCGAICDMITSTTDKVPIYLGKPNPDMVTLCQKLSGFDASQTLVVGDRLYTDIACGLQAGVDTCLLLTGEASRADISTTEFPPDVIFDTVQDLLLAIDK